MKQTREKRSGKTMKQYLAELQRILDEGKTKMKDRTGTGTVGLFGTHQRYNLWEGFPLVTTKKTFLRGIIHELLWFLDGDTSNLTLLENDVHIWDKWQVNEEMCEDHALTLNERMVAYIRRENMDAAALGVQLEEHQVAYANKHGADAETPWSPHLFLDEKEIDRNVKVVYADGGRPMDNFTRLSLWAETTGQSFEAAQAKLQACETEEVAHAIMDKDNIPREIRDIAAYIGDLGPIYGEMWRSWPNPDGTVVDQIDQLMHNLKSNPDSRRHVVSAWNPSFLPDESISPQENAAQGRACLAYCHPLFQFYTEEMSFEERYEYWTEVCGGHVEGGLEGGEEHVTSVLDACDVPTRSISCQLYQRSADWPVGVPFNIASYALFTMMIAQQLNFAAKEFIHTTGDSHVYLNQVDLAREQLTRTPHKLPKMNLVNKPKDIFSYTIDNFVLEGYEHDEAIPYPVSM